MKQQQFLDVVSEAVAHERFDGACAHLAPRVVEIGIEDALGRVLADDVRAAVDVPSFDRSNVDGFAVRAADTFGAEELAPVTLALDELSIAAGDMPPDDFALPAGTAVAIATGAVVPRGADAVVMVEYTLIEDGRVQIQRSVAPGALVSWAGTDLGRGEVVQRRGTRLSSRDTGLLAAVGAARVSVFDPPRVAILSTGDEVRAPGEELRPGEVYDSNARILADAVTEAGGTPVSCGIFPDDEARLAAALRGVLTGDDAADVVLLSGGTSKGAGDLNGRVVEALGRELADSAGVVVHGVALKPGKPVLLAVVAGRPVVVLPGFPTSAIFTFHEFVAPLVRRLAGRRAPRATVVDAVTPLRINSVEGRTQYSLVNLVEGPDGLAAYPLGAGSGSMSTFSRADGFVRIPDATEYVPEGARVHVRLLGPGVRPADLVAIGSHCIGQDWLLGQLAARGFRTKAVAVGSTGGLTAVARGEGDVAGVHLLDAASGEYNRAFLPDGARLLPGYGRRQGLVFRRGDARFEGKDLDAFLASVGAPGCRMINRNPGSGTRILLDQLLAGGGVTERPDGYHAQARSHHAVAAAVAQGRADWGMTLDVLADASNLGFLFVRDERFDFAVPAARWDRPAVAALRALLAEDDTRSALADLGLVS